MSLLTMAKKIFRRDRTLGSKKQTAAAKSVPREQSSEAAGRGAKNKQAPHIQSILAGQIGLQLMLSERSMRLQEKNTVVFRVNVAATKREIQQAVTDRYGAKVLSIRTATFAPKTRRRGATWGRTNAWKKVYVTVADVQPIAAGP